jgi:iron complex outermembrane receptor protein
MTGIRKNSARIVRARLLAGSALAMIASMGAAQAQNGAAETVVVTGTSIRGAAPVGANVITLDSAQIESTGAVTTQDLLTNIPSLTGFGNQGAGTDARGGLGTADASGSSSPNIHSLGASSSSTTLVLVDGHRVPLSGLSHTLVDPSIIAPDAIARVDVLPDGTSAIYGSDASAGVVNIITKKRYSGLEFSGQYGGADQYTRSAFGLSFGKSWDDGAAMIAYDFQSNSHLMTKDRAYLASNLVARGGANLASFNCAPATVAGTGTTGTTGTAPVYVYPYTAASIGSSATATGAISAAPCDTNGVTSLLPSEVRHNVLASFTQQFGDRINVNVDVGFSNHITANQVSRGTLTSIAFGPGSAANASLEPLSAAAVASYNAVATANGQPTITATNVTAASAAALKSALLLGAQANPFYQSGTTGLTTSEGIRYDFNDLFGPGAYTKGGQLDVFVAGSIDVNLFGDWVATLAGTAGLDDSTSKSRGVVNTNAANLALNGTTNANGTAVTSAGSSAQVDQFGLGGTINVTRVPLTAATALDVWNPAATNQTSATVRAQLLDNNAGALTQQELNDLKLSFTGTLFSLPAGDLKTAFGAEYLMNNFVTGAREQGASIFGFVNTSATNFKANRSEWAEFLELRIPVIGPDMNMPLIQSFDLDVAGRHDHYTTFGDTENPKVSFSWVATDGIKFTGSYGTSFVAPALTALPAAFGAGVAVNANGGNQGILATHVNAPGSWCAAGCVLDAAHPGLTITGAQNSNAETALTHTFGIDIQPGRFIPALNGLHINVGYWDNKSKGLITTPTLANEAQVPGLQSQLLLAPPGGWTPTSPALLAAIAGIPLNGVLQPTIWYVYHNVQQNAFNILANGIDFDVSYAFQTDDAGDFVFDVAGSDKLRFDETPYPAGASTRFLNGYNVNTTFSSLAFTGRASVSWHMDPITASLAVNFVNPYLFQTTNRLANPVSMDGLTFQHVHASYPLDLHLSYAVPQDWSPYTTGMQISVTVNNLLDQKPPFYNSGLGYDPDNASPVGRVSMVSVRKKF